MYAFRSRSTRWLRGVDTTAFIDWQLAEIHVRVAGPRTSIHGKGGRSDADTKRCMDVLVAGERGGTVYR